MNIVAGTVLGAGFDAAGARIGQAFDARKLKKDNPVLYHVNVESKKKHTRSKTILY